MSENQNITVEQAWEVVHANFIRIVEANEPNHEKVSDILNVRSVSDEVREKRNAVLNYDGGTVTKNMVHIVENSESFELFVWLTFQNWIQEGEHWGEQQAQAKFMFGGLKSILGK